VVWPQSVLEFEGSSRGLIAAYDRISGPAMALFCGLRPEEAEKIFDNIGNRTFAETGGDASGWNLRSASFTNNSLNQLTRRDVPDGFDVLGLATDRGWGCSIGIPIVQHHLRFERDA